MIGEFDLLIPGRLIRELVLMVEIERDPAISQSRLADKAGLVPSMVNNYIRMMSEQGLLHKEGASRRRTTYHLTQQGRDRCAELMRRYSIETVRLYKYAKGEFRRRLAERFRSLRGMRIVIYGAAETGELVYQVCLEMGCRVVGVVDSNPAMQGRKMFGCRVASPSEIDSMNADVVLISSLGHAEEIENYLQPLSERGVEIHSVGDRLTV
jgi:predicted transcriptional regulator